jgi:hypothetical protein
MILAQTHPRHQFTFHQPSDTIAQSDQHWSSYPTQSPTPSQSLHNTNFFFGENPSFDLQPQQQPLNYHYLRIQVQTPFGSSQTPGSMQSEQSNNSWFSNGQLTPTSAEAHHRESSLSTLGSAGPASPYNVSTSNPHIIALQSDPLGNSYYDLHDNPQYSKPLTPAHTPSQEHFLTTPQYSNYNLHNLHTMGDAELMPAPEFSHSGRVSHSGRPSITSVASNDSPSTLQSYNDGERQKTEYSNAMPKFNRTMTDICEDELYSPTFEITEAPSGPAQTTMLSPNQNEIIKQRLQAANNRHLSVSIQVPLTVPSRERSPFRQGSPLAPSGNTFGSQSPCMGLGTASQTRQQQKLEIDARVFQEQIQKTSPEQTTPKTISPKDIDLVYHEDEVDTRMPLFPPQKQQSPRSRQQSILIQDPSQSDVDDTASQQSYGSMATTRRESSSAYSAASQATQQQSSNFNFTPPAVPGGIRQISQQYPFVPQSRRQPSSMSNVTKGFPATLTSKDSSSSEYAPDTSDLRKPTGSMADGGTYTCTYHNCTLRFDAPAKLQKHKRDGHRQSASLIGEGESGSGMTSVALRNSQAGPHKCERINPSTGKPCNTIFSRPYDLTRHEDTIHNTRKQKVRCHLCTEEKTFSRNDALTRHFRVCHPNVNLPGKSRRSGLAHD